MFHAGFLSNISYFKQVLSLWRKHFYFGDVGFRPDYKHTITSRLTLEDTRQVPDQVFTVDNLFGNYK